MSPQLITTVVGLALSVLVIGGGTMSMQQSGDAAKAKKLAVEVDSVINASRSWVANSTADNTFNGVNAAAVGAYVVGMTVTGTGSSSVINSVAVPAGQTTASPVTLGVAAAITTVANDSVRVTISNVPSAMQPILTASLTGKGCTAGAFATNAMTYTCKG